MKICTYCGNQARDQASFCSSCGASSFQNKCNSCSNVFSGGYCPQCGVRAGARAKTCPDCGTVYFSNACPSCGYLRRMPVLPTAPEPIAPKVVSTDLTPMPPGRACNKWVALLLCIFFGIFGVHKFYEGRIASGLVYLFTGGFMGIGWMIDVIALLFKPDTYYV